jgi:hypothetical protein
MKQTILAFSLSLGCLIVSAAQSQAQIDINVNGIEYDITTVTASAYIWANEDPFFGEPFESGNVYFDNAPAAGDPGAPYQEAYVAAGGDPSVEFVTYFGVDSVQGDTGGYSWIYGNPPVGDSWFGYFPVETFAFATVIVPESADYGWVAASFLIVCTLANTVHNSYRKDCIT